ncbi:CLUMA_CG018359, isoform A [Clunio marinus]|uniref:CLUMA_CG018359, isoform A n=1 Tax=Clunio marinus TaxID=568069 RepID=A0A1J1J344_9DIPT|nr:CLUMA_CG018359, isoform A [Clunio marinus]
MLSSENVVRFRMRETLANKRPNDEFQFHSTVSKHNICSMMIISNLTTKGKPMNLHVVIFSSSDLNYIIEPLNSEKSHRHVPMPCLISVRKRFSSAL